MAEGYYAGNQAQAEQAPRAVNRAHAPTVLGGDARPMTEMENLCASLADTARHLKTTANLLAGRVDGFMQAAQPIEKQPPEEIEPQPGTLSALRYWHRKIEGETMRLSAIQTNLAGIL